MKENKRDSMRLDDDLLEGVSGGTMEKDKVFLPCVYCGVKQEMLRYKNVSVRCGNYVYRNAIKYVCPDKTRLFHVIMEDGKGWLITDTNDKFPAPMVYYVDS